MGRNYYVFLGPKQKHYFSLPPKWVPVHFLENPPVATVPSVVGMAREALDRPVGAPPLREMVSKGARVAIIVDDGTRPTPASDILSVLLPRLLEAGCPREATTIVIALGTHAVMSEQALAAKLGASVVSTCRVVQHNAWQDDLVSVRIPGDGRIVRVNPAVANATVRIGVSSILPHSVAGYGGGPKLLMPGVSNIDFIMHHHMKNANHPGSKLGLLKGNPFQGECMKVALAIGLDLTIDCVYDREGRISRIIAGGLEAAFAEAVEACSETLGHRFPELMDVSVASSYPHMHGIQFYKGLAAANIITRAEGAIVLAAPMATPVPDEFVRAFVRVKEEAQGDPASYVGEFMSKGMPFLPDHSAEFNMAMSFAIRRPRIRTILVSPAVSRDTAATLGFEYSPSVEEAVDTLGSAYPEARVAILPSGGLVVPIVDEE